MADAYDETEELEGEIAAPDKEPKSSKSWLAMIAEAEKAFQAYQDKADNIDKLYANLDRLASSTRDRQFQMFWANIAVLGPSIYSRPPVPVVVPRFQDRRPLQRITSELLERSAIVTFDLQTIDYTMRQVRDDLVILARGVVWVRYETKGDYATTERVCIEHVDRKDFLTHAAREWPEVDWVAKRSFLTKKAMRKRFAKFSGKAYADATYTVQKDGDDSDDKRPKAGVWELWCKSQNKVVWVTDGCEKVLDEGEPHLTLEGFFPCPRPAFATLQRRTLIPIPDMVFYKDQLEEINELTARIAALCDAVKVRGFYPAGAGEIGDAVEAAIKTQSDNAVLIPVSNWSLLGGTSPKDAIVWLPLADIVSAITQLVEMRKQLIDDVYQITGLSDIMRGSTEASETLGAQQLKSQYGSIRIRDRTDELVRLARDITSIVCEIMSENFSSDTLLDMSQLEIPSVADMRKQIAPLEAQIKSITLELQKAKTDPETVQLAQQNPEKAQQVFQQAQQQVSQLQEQIQKLEQTPTIEQVMKGLRDQKTRPFVLDIETDSTIAPDENAQKQRATEYLTAMGTLMAQALPAIQMMPAAAPLLGETIRFAQSQFRVGRQMDQVVDEFVDQMKQMGSQPKGPDPAQAKAQAEAQAMQQDAQIQAQAHQADLAAKQQDAQMKQQEVAATQQREDARLQADLQVKEHAAQAIQREHEAKISLMGADDQRAQQKHAQDLENGSLANEKLRLEIEGVKVKTAATVQTTQANVDAKQATTDATVEAKRQSVKESALA